MAEARDLHIDSVLTNMSVQYRNEDMIWREVMPEVKVNKRSDLYWKYAKENGFRIYDDKIGPKSEANEIDFAVSTDNYSVKDHALADYVAQEEIDNSDSPLAPESDANDFINQCLDVSQEQRVSGIVFAAGTYPVGNKVTLSGTSQWSDSADNPIKNVQDAVEGCFMRANTLIFGIDAWLVFRRLPEILDAVKAIAGTNLNGGLATPSAVANLFEVDRILIGRSRYITTKEGQTATFARLWGKHMAALHIKAGNPGIRSVTFGKTFVETARVTTRMFDQKKGLKGSHYIKVGFNSDEKIIASDLGYFIENAVA
ncbi:MAG: hypothetical protein OEY77_00285 [Nitrospira sp.]|nr:hypothetical protein [Nitrospira sp.]